MRKSFEMPGPGSYVPPEKVGKEGKKFTILGRPKSVEKSKGSPGPASYNPKIIDDTAGSQGFRLN